VPGRCKPHHNHNTLHSRLLAVNCSLNLCRGYFYALRERKIPVPGSREDAQSQLHLPAQSFLMRGIMVQKTQRPDTKAARDAYAAAAAVAALALQRHATHDHDSASSTVGKCSKDEKSASPTRVNTTQRHPSNSRARTLQESTK
jgi:hypothetical protein